MAEYYFNLPPISDLTLTQKAAVNQIGAIALSGSAGTGKSVVSLYRHINRNSTGSSCQLLTFTTTLALYLEKCCRLQNTDASNRITTINKWIFKYNRNPNRREIIIDEAQDLGYAYLESSDFGDILTYRKKNKSGETNSRINIHSDFFKCNYSKISYGADDAQALARDNGINEQELRSIYSSNIRCILDRNYRNTKRILRLAQTSFPHANISDQVINSCRTEGEYPLLKICDEDEIISEILEIIEAWSNDTHNIGILCSSKDEVLLYYGEIKDRIDDCTYYINDNEGIRNINNVHITTFKSAKGLEFDTVIIPSFDEAISGSSTNWKEFYVGVTRAKSNLYLFSEEDLPQIEDYVELL